MDNFTDTRTDDQLEYTEEQYLAEMQADELPGWTPTEDELNEMARYYGEAA